MSNTDQEEIQARVDPEVEGPKLEDLEEGTDFAELLRGQGTNKLQFAYKGKRWTFKYIEVNWQTHFRIVEESYFMAKKADPVTGKVTEEQDFDLKSYYEDIFMEAIVEGPGSQGVTRPMLRELDSFVIQKLVNVVPAPKLQDELYEVKKA